LLPSCPTDGYKTPYICLQKSPTPTRIRYAYGDSLSIHYGVFENPLAYRNSPCQSVLPIILRCTYKILYPPARIQEFPILTHCAYRNPLVASDMLCSLEDMYRSRGQLLSSVIERVDLPGSRYRRPRHARPQLHDSLADLIPLPFAIIVVTQPCQTLPRCG
jgi:hypothetical protein